MNGRKPENHRKYIGKRFGKLVVTGFSHKDKYSIVFVNAGCACGKQKTVRLASLKAGRTRSCGCLKSALHTARLTKHGGKHTKLYAVWCSMKARCNNPKDTDYRLYGAKGVSVCEEWSNNFAEFRGWAELNGYRSGLSIDRKDSNGNYEPLNCRWATPIVQSNNTKRNIPITFQGKTQNVSQWADDLKMAYKTLHDRLFKLGWSTEEALTKPVRKLHRRNAEEL